MARGPGRGQGALVGGEELVGQEEAHEALQAVPQQLQLPGAERPAHELGADCEGKWRASGAGVVVDRCLRSVPEN